MCQKKTYAAAIAGIFCVIQRAPVFRGGLGGLWTPRPCGTTNRSRFHSVVAVWWRSVGMRCGGAAIMVSRWIAGFTFFGSQKICGRRCVVLSTFDCPAVLLRTSLRTVATVALFVVCPVGITFQPVTHAGRKVHASFRFLLRMFLFFRTPRQSTTSRCSKNGGARNFIVPEPFFFPIFAFRFFRLAKSQTLSHEHTASSGQQTPR